MRSPPREAPARLTRQRFSARRPAHNPDLLLGWFSPSGGQHVQGDRRPFAAPHVAGGQRYSAVRFSIWRSPAPWAVCPPSTQRVCLCYVAHFAHWLTREPCGLSAIGETLIARFQAEHMPACNCPYPVRRLRHELRAALAQLLEVLRADGVGALDPCLGNGRCARVRALLRPYA